MSIERMPEEIIQKEVSRVPEKDSMELILGRAVSNMGDLVHTVDGKTRKYFEGLKENFEGALDWLETQKAKATRVALAGTLVGQLATACSPRTVDAKDILSLTPAETQEYIPEPAETEVLPTITVTPEPSLTATAKPTEAPTPERPEELKEVSSSKDTSWIDKYSKNYSDELWAAITLGEFKEQEKAWGEMIQNFYGNAENAPFFSQEPGSEKSSLVYVYLEDQNNPGSVIVALASPDYPNKFIFPPFDFSKSKGLDVKFTTTSEDGSSPLFLTVTADEESVQKGEMQERFLGTTLTNKGGELVRIDNEGKVIAKIGVKPETLEARWVRPLYKGEGADWENFTIVGLDEIMNEDGTPGPIIFDYEVQSGWVKGERDFPNDWEKSEFQGSTYYDLKPISDAQKYFHDMYRLYLKLDNGKHQIIEVQQIDFGDMQKFVHYPKGRVGDKALGGMLGADQLSIPGSASKYNPNFWYYGLTASDIKRSENFYAKGGALEKMMDSWLIENQGQVFDDNLSTVLFFGGTVTQK